MQCILLIAAKRHAADWFRKAAERDFGGAQNNLAIPMSVDSRALRICLPNQSTFTGFAIAAGRLDKT
jgi:hypothetical protein